MDNKNNSNKINNKDIDIYNDKFCGQCNKLVYRYNVIDIRDKRFYYGRIDELCKDCYDSFVCSNCHSFECIYTSYECKLDQLGYDITSQYWKLHR